MPQSEPEIDHAKMQYPTDKVTVGQLRARQPELLNGKALYTSRLTNTTLAIVGTMSLEHDLAAKAFAKAAGLPDPDPDPLVSRREAMRMLNEDYRRYGISSGLQQTKELVRAFEAAAARQGKAALGTSR